VTTRRISPHLKRRCPPIVRNDGNVPESAQRRTVRGHHEQLRDERGREYVSVVAAVGETFDVDWSWEVRDGSGGDGTAVE
jgi:hypothetical protein